MKFIKSMWNKIKKPKAVFLVLFYIFFMLILLATLMVLIFQPEQSILHYVLYALSFVSLVYFIYTIIILAPIFKQHIIRFLRKFKFTNEMLDNYGYRTIMFSIFSFILNIAYVIFIGTLAIKTHSAWYISITAYYLILIIMKGNVFYTKKKNSNAIKQIKAYRFSGIMFILLTLAFSGIIVLIYASNMYFEYAGLMIYVVATYTFYKLTLAIINIFKAKKQEDLYVQSIRNINLVSALVSIVVLQVAMFQEFSPANNTGIANGLTGGVVSIIILLLGILMIIKSNKMLQNDKMLQKENKNEG